MKYFNEYLGLFLLVVAVIIAEPFMSAIRDFSATPNEKSRKEGFAATYPKKGAGYGIVLRENDSENNSKLYPVAANLSNYDQATNNVRDWITPDNGSCKPAGMCGALYAPKAPDDYKVPDPLPLDHPGRRVGFYAVGGIQ